MIKFQSDFAILKFILLLVIRENIFAINIRKNYEKLLFAFEYFLRGFYNDPFFVFHLLVVLA